MSGSIAQHTANADDGNGATVAMAGGDREAQILVGLVRELARMAARSAYKAAASDAASGLNAA